jgi:excisionase family DNA binding protein
VNYGILKIEGQNFIPLEHAAWRAHVPAPYLQRVARSGELSFREIKNHFFISESSLNTYIAQRVPAQLAPIAQKEPENPVPENHIEMDDARNVSQESDIPATANVPVNYTPEENLAVESYLDIHKVIPVVEYVSKKVPLEIPHSSPEPELVSHAQEQFQDPEPAADISREIPVVEHLSEPVAIAIHDPVPDISAHAMSIAEAATLAGLSENYIGKLVRSGEIASLMHGTEQWIPKDSLDAFIVRRATRLEERRVHLAQERARAYSYADAAVLSPISIGQSPTVVTRTTEFARQLSVLAIAIVIGGSIFALAQAPTREAFTSRAQSMMASASESIGGMTAQAGASSSVLADLARSVNANVNALFYSITAGSNASTALADNVPKQIAMPRATALVPTIAVNAAATTTTVRTTARAPIINQTIIQQPVIERIVQTQQSPFSGVSQQSLTEQLQQLSNKLSSQMYSLTSANSNAIAQNYIVTAQSNAINQLSNVTITNPTITGGSIGGATFASNGLTGTVSVANGGTGTSTAPAYGQMLLGNAAGGYDLVATSSLGILGGGASVWGAITGTLSDQTDLQAALDAKLSLTSWYATTTDALAQGSTNKYYSTTLFAGSLAATTTTALAEGANKYWTDIRFDNRLSATTSLPNLTTLANLTSVGTITSGTWSGLFGAVSGANLTNITAANISAGTAGINVTGNAGTATALQTARNINGTSFNGSADITITAASSTLLANNNTFSGANSFTGTSVFGSTSSDLLTINSSINSSLIPNGNKIFDLGSPSYFWRTAYVDTLNVNSLSAASTTIGGTQSAAFTINTDNASSDTEDMSLIFYRGVVVPNAVIAWNSALNAKRFEFNQPIYVSNQSGSTTQTTLALKGVAGQTGNLFSIASSSGTNLFAIASDGSVTLTNATTTNIFSTTASSTNLFATNANFGVLTAGTLNLTGGFVSQASSTVVGNFTSTGIVAGSSFTGAGTGLTGTASALSIGGNAGTATKLAATKNINGVAFDGSADITISAASSTLLTNSNTFSGTNAFTGPTTFANATSTNLFSTTASSTNLFAQGASFGSISFTNIIGVANGGTGVGTLTGIAIGNGTSAFTAGTTQTCTNQFVRSMSAAYVATCASVNLASDVTGTLAVGNGGTGITSFGTGIATFLGTPSSANLAAALTDETGTGSAVFAGSPTFTGTSHFPAIDINNGSADGGEVVWQSSGFGAWTMDNNSGRLRAYYNGTTENFSFFNNGGLSLGQSYTGTTPPANGSIIQGNVGIGTTNPGATLDVAGVINGRNYSLPSTASGVQQWTKVGTFTAGQTGQTIRITAYIHGGYNAMNSQDSTVYITFKTSNGVSVDANGFAGNSSWYAVGENASITSGSIKWKANAAGVSATSYDLYMYLPAYTSGSNYEVNVNKDASWTDSGGLVAQADPGSASSSVLIPAPVFALSQGNVGIGTTTPFRKFAVQNTASLAQAAIAYDATRVTELYTDSGGDYHVTPSGQDEQLDDSNLWVCSGGSCPAGAPSGTGNLIIENKVGVGTSTPTDQLSVQGLLRVGANSNAVVTMGTATSTFNGDVKILGKLDVATIDPVYMVDGVKYATYGASTVGIHEEVVSQLQPSEWNAAKNMYEYTIDFKSLEKGSDLWLFSQVTDFGPTWQNLVVTLTPGFDGRTFYEQDVDHDQLHIYASQKGLVSLRMIANRYDFSKWNNLRPDQDGNAAGAHVITTK